MMYDQHVCRIELTICKVRPEIVNELLISIPRNNEAFSAEV